MMPPLQYNEVVPGMMVTPSQAILGPEGEVMRHGTVYVITSMNSWWFQSNAWAFLVISR